jgi:uncharacterized protein (TIGR02611 family)
VKRGGAVLKRVLVEGAGWLLVLAGIAALALPGPGLLMLFAGLAILSQQYDWAERRVEPVQRAALKAAAQGVQTWPRILASLLGVVWLCGIGVLWFLQPPAPDWWPADDKWWLFGGSATGITLFASGLLALAMIVYSFVKFRGADDPHAEVDDVVGSDH